MKAINTKRVDKAERLAQEARDLMAKVVESEEESEETYNWVEISFIDDAHGHLVETLESIEECRGAL